MNRTTEGMMLHEKLDRARESRRRTWRFQVDDRTRLELWELVDGPDRVFLLVVKTRQGGTWGVHAVEEEQDGHLAAERFSFKIRESLEEGCNIY